MPKINKYLSPNVITKLRFAIKEANYNEVFFIGKVNSEKVVFSVSIIARGNEAAVPVIRRKANAGNVLIHNHPSDILKPSDNDLHISNDLAGFGIANYIINNNVTDIFVITELFSKHDTKFIDSDKLSSIISPGGAIAKKLPGYEFRSQQVEMIKEICNAFNNDKIAVIEAGTGVGKTLAYLLPAIFWSLKNKERCTISTNTINLQEQLIKKDIPFLQSILDEKFNAVLVKGRRNYICLRKIDDVERMPDLFLENVELKEINTLIEWAKHSNDGSKSDLNFVPKEQTWDKVAAESDTCIFSRCKFYNKCFVNLARRSANNAHILVVNHHMLFADLSVRATGAEVAILPSYKRLIFDEAHNIEGIATNYFGGGTTRIGTDRILGRLYRVKDGNGKGFLPFLTHSLMEVKQDVNNEVLDEIILKIDNEIIPMVGSLVSLNDTAMDSIFNLIYTNVKNEFGEIKCRITSKLKDHPSWNNILIDRIYNFLSVLNKFCTKLVKNIAKLDECEIEFSDDIYALTVSIYSQCDRLLSIKKTIEDVLFEEDDTNIRWAEIKPGNISNITRLRICPLDIAKTMKEVVYEKFDTIIMTSATLTVTGIKNWNEFDYISSRIGLSLIDNDRLNVKVLPPPFNYKKQVLVGIPTNIPFPDNPDFSEEIAKLLIEYINIIKGGIFILFTSYGLLNIIHSKLQPVLSKRGYTILKQGSMNRHRLLEIFKNDKSAILFATDSFWEGVDVPGEALSSVVIVKLPFKVPTEPVIQARTEVIKMRGGNPFMEFSVPQAVIKLKQGFGRLIRNKTDRGIVLILDKRVIEKFYGKIFLKSLPETKIISGTQKSLLRQIKEWL